MSAVTPELLDIYVQRLDSKKMTPLEVIKRLNNFRFTNWNTKLTAGSNIVEKSIETCETPEQIQQILDILPAGDAASRGLDDTIAGNILNMGLVPDTLHKIYKSLNKFTGIDLLDFAIKLVQEMGTDFSVVDLIQSRDAFKDQAVVNLLIQEAPSLRQYIDTAIYRNDTFGAAVDKDAIQLDRLSILFKIGEPLWPTVETLQTIINFLEFDGWSDPVTEDPGAPTFIEQLVDQSDAKTLPTIIDILPGEDAAAFGLTAQVINTIIQKKHAHADPYLQEVLRSLSKFTEGVEVAQIKDLAKKIMTEAGDDLFVGEVLEAHPAFQDQAVIDEFVRSPISLQNFASLVAYRQMKFEIGLVPDDILAVQDLIGTRGWAVEDILPTLQNSSFTGWGNNLGHGRNILDVTLSKSKDIVQVSNIFKEASKIEGIVVNDGAINSILQIRPTGVQLANIVKIFSDSQNLELLPLVSAIQQSELHIHGATLLKSIDEGKAPEDAVNARSIIPVLVSTVRNVKELSSLLAYTRPTFGVGLDTVVGDDGKALSTYLSQPMAAEVAKVNREEAVKKLPDVAIRMGQGIYREVDNTLLENLQLFAGWNDALKDGKTFLQIGLDYCQNLTAVNNFLKVCAKSNLPIAITYRAIDTIFNKAADDATNMESVIRTFNKFADIDWVKVANKASAPPVRYGPNNQINPVDFISLLEKAPNPVVISKLVEQIIYLDQFSEIMTVCVTKLGMSFDMPVGEQGNHIITYLPRTIPKGYYGDVEDSKLTDLQQLSLIAQELGRPIDWASKNNKGEMLAGKVIARSSGALLQKNVDFLLGQETRIDWNRPLESDGAQNNLLLLIANSSQVTRGGKDLQNIWNVILNLLTRKGPDGLPMFNVNWQNQSKEEHERERLIDKAKYIYDNAKTDMYREQGELDFSRTEALKIINELRNFGSVEPTQFIVTHNLQINREYVHHKQNDDAMKILLPKILDKYHLVPKERLATSYNTTAEHKEMLDAMEAYVCKTIPIDPTWDAQHRKECEDQREILRNGKKNQDNGGIIWQAERLIKKGKGDLAGGHTLTWYWGATIAHLWQAAKEFGRQEAFFAVFPGLQQCDWGLLINLFYPFCKNFMDPGVQIVDYGRIVAVHGELIQKSALEKLKTKLGRWDDAKLSKIVADAFLDFVEARNDKGGPLPENWALGTQLVVSAFNEAFAENIRSARTIIDQRFDGMVESYHFDEFLKCFVTSFITDPATHRGALTQIFLDTLGANAEHLLAELSAHPAEEADDIISRYDEEHGKLLDLSYIPVARTERFARDLGDKKIAVFKALNSNKVKLSTEFDKVMTATLAQVKLAEFTKAVDALINKDETRLTEFSKNWSLDKETSVNVIKTLPQKLDAHKLQLVLKTLNSARYLKKAQDASMELNGQYKAVKKDNTEKLVKSVLADLPNAEKLIDEFTTSLKELDLNCLDTNSTMKLIKAGNGDLTNKLVTDDKILFDWTKLIEEGDNTALLFDLVDIAQAADEPSEDKINDLRKASTQNLAHNIEANPQNASQLIRDFIARSGSLDLNLLETEQLNSLLEQADYGLVNTILTSKDITIDWSKSSGIDKHTFLYTLSHMAEGRFKQDAVNIYNAHLGEEDWLLINGEVLLNGDIGQSFGDFIE